MSRLRMRLVLTAALLAAPVEDAARAQEPSPAAPRFNAEVVVTPERDETLQSEVPAATVVLDGARLPALPALSLGETMSFVPGLQVARGELYAGRPVISGRGFFGGGEAEYVLLLVDGVPMADAESGLIDWSAVPIGNIRRIEVLRGPGASAYGDSAIGGVIQVFTDRHADAGRATVSGGSFRTLAADGAYGRRRGALGLQVSGAARRTDGFADHSATRDLTGQGSVERGVGTSTWRASASGYRREIEDPGALALDVARATPRASDSMFASDGSVRRGFSTSAGVQGVRDDRGHQARVYANGRSEEVTRTILLVPGFGDRRTRELSTWAVGGGAEGTRTIGPPASRGVVRFGATVSRESLTTTYAPIITAVSHDVQTADAEGRRIRVGGFLSGGVNPAASVRVSAAVRVDRVSDGGFGPGAAGGRTHLAWSPRLGVTLGLTEAGDLTLFGQVSRAFKAPTLDQMFDPRPYPDFRGGTFTISNALLVPHYATNVEGGVMGTSGGLRWSALAYRMVVEDEIDFDLLTFRYNNIGESRHTGVELEAGFHAGRVQPFISYVLTRVVDRELGLQLKNVPRHAVTAGTHVVLPWGLSAYVRYRATAGAFLDDPNLFAVEGRSMLDLRLRRLFGHQALFVDVLNATDDTYEEFGFTLTDVDGRVFPYAWPGSPRAIRAGVQLTF
jgi:outer membrane cobalamin receptor